MSDGSKNPSRPDLDSARAAIRANVAPPVASGEPDLDGTFFDEPAPTRAPGDKGIEIPAHLKEIAAFFQEAVFSEGFLLELCLDRAIEIVTDAVNRRVVGIDNFSDGSGSSGLFTPAHYAGIAAPLTVELYKNVLLNIEGRKDEYAELLKKASEKAEELRQERIRAAQKSPIGKGGIILP